MNKRRIKIFSHNDLDGFGAPYLLDNVQDTVFPDTEFEITNIGAGKIDSELDYWMTHDDINSFTDLYIMDMTPDSEHSFKELNEHFANHWLLFDHHETEAALRQKYTDNSVTGDQGVNQSAVSLVWSWLQKQAAFNSLSGERKQALGQIVELIRAYDTWDWQNDDSLSAEEKVSADELDQLFWFYPLDFSQEFIQKVYKEGWPAYREANKLLIMTLSDRRKHYLHSHLKDTIIDKLDGHTWGFVYADDYKSEIAHALLQEHPEAEAAMVLSAKSVSLRSNGKLNVAQFAEKYFGGGGHADAAGGRLQVNMISSGERTVIKHLQAEIKRVHDNEKANTETLADTIDPALATKMAALFKSDQNK